MVRYGKTDWPKWLPEARCRAQYSKRHVFRRFVDDDQHVVVARCSMASCFVEGQVMVVCKMKDDFPEQCDFLAMNVDDGKYADFRKISKAIYE